MAFSASCRCLWGGRSSSAAAANKHIKMFRRTTLLIPYNGQQQVRGMATLKAIAMRLKSVKNIQKITQSMKMVSAAKFARAERELKVARPYGAGATAFYDKAEVKAEEEKPTELIVACSSDRGLCAGIHSAICKFIKAELADDASKAAILCIGDKSRAQLSRTLAKNIIAQVGEVGRKPATFEDAGRIATFILNSGYDFGSGRIIYNRFRTVVSYDTKVLPFYNASAISAADKISVYDSLDSDVIQSYMEYSLSSLLFFTLKEGATAEQSSRMTAMDNATKNAGEMIDKLTLTYNRTRQAVITGELIEIISGAAAV